VGEAEDHGVDGDRKEEEADIRIGIEKCEGEHDAADRPGGPDGRVVTVMPVNVESQETPADETSEVYQQIGMYRQRCLDDLTEEVEGKGIEAEVEPVGVEETGGEEPVVLPADQNIVDAEEVLLEGKGVPQRVERGEEKRDDDDNGDDRVHNLNLC